MEKAVDRLETAAAGVARRRREAEEAKQRAEEEARRREEREKERARRRLEMAREREEAETQARVADAEKRRAFLQKTLDIREAHKRLRQYREHVISQPPPTQRLLQGAPLNS
jgi:dTMP kinase